MAAPSLFQFQAAREQLFDSVNSSLQSDDVAILEKTYSDIHGSDAEKKMSLDQALRDVLNHMIDKDSATPVYLSVISLAASAVQHELCSVGTLFMLLQDIFDSITLDKCDEVFTYLEDRVKLWKSDTYYNAGKNYLLRMCNDLLRRHSKSQNTVFCGRIQLFLARLFPLSEKSGLNLMSQFNLENITHYNTKPEEYDKARKTSVDEKEENAMDIEEGEMDDRASLPIDYNIYRKFWLLQDYFRKPGQCYDKGSWKTFSSFADEVLGCFESFKLDDVKTSRRRRGPSQDTNKTDSPNTYFPKYLTSEKLLDLQVSDSNFRRYVLVQFLITFQYLDAPVRFKSATQILGEDQATWVKQTQERVLKLIKETPPDGDRFAEAIEDIMRREENWNNWKNDGCPTYVRVADSEERPKPMGRGKKRSLGDDLKASGGKLIKMGSAELTRLWNLCPDNMEACRSQQRNFMPQMEEFFEDAIEEADPEAMVEDCYKHVNNETFAWKSLRLLARQSPYFFAQGQQQQQNKTVPQYLELMIGKLAKELPSTQTEEMKAEADEEGVVQGNNAEENLADNKQDDEEDDGDDQADQGQTKDESVLLPTAEQVKALAERMTGDWKKLATELNFPEEDAKYLESETDDAKAQATKMITLWMESENERRTIAMLRHALEEIGQVAVANEVFGAGEDTS